MLSFRDLSDVAKVLWNLPRSYKFQLVAILVIPVILVGSLAILSVKSAEAERKRRESFSYKAELESLDSVRKSLNELTNFVELEKERLQESEDLVNNLKAEQEKLKPVVETNRQVIEAIFDLQYQRTRADVWKERWIGFGSGVLASVIASFMYGLLRRISERKKSAPPAGVV